MVSQKVHLRRCDATSSLRRTCKCASLLSFCAPCLVGASGARPKMGVRPDAPTIVTIVMLTFYGIIQIGRI